jgi:uncharacterized repeat protein (TIGR03833 family)
VVDAISVPSRSDVQVGQLVWGVEKRNYASGVLTKGKVKRILTKKSYHSRGIKVMLEGGVVVRVQRLSPPVVESSPPDLDAEGELR